MDKFYPQRTILLHLNVFLVPQDMLKLIFQPLQKVTKSGFLLSVTSPSWGRNDSAFSFLEYQFFFYSGTMPPSFVCQIFSLNIFPSIWCNFYQLKLSFSLKLTHRQGGYHHPHQVRNVDTPPPHHHHPLQVRCWHTPPPHHHHPLQVRCWHTPPPPPPPPPNFHVDTPPPHHHHPSAQFCVQFLVTFWASRSLSLIEFHSIDNEWKTFKPGSDSDPLVFFKLSYISMWIHNFRLKVAV